MRIVNWNCCRGSHESKLPPLLRLKPDVAVIQETPRPEHKLADCQLWHGNNVKQGLLVMSFGGWKLEQFGKLKDDPQFFLPVRVIGPKEQFNLLAVWVKPGTKRPLYFRTLFDGLMTYKNFLWSSPTVIVGDFNVSFFDSEISYTFDLTSAYHTFFKEKISREKKATLYFYRRRSRRFHYDFCYIPKRWRKRLKTVEVGGFDKWIKLSDHMPLTVDIIDKR